MSQNVRPTISIVIPIFNAEKFLPVLWQRLQVSMSNLSSKFEVIFVDDASPDLSWKWIKDAAEKDQRIKGVRLRKNKGQQNAILCGLGQAVYDVVVTMDGDLQHRPEDIHLLVEKLQDECVDVVVAKFDKKKHSLIRNIGTFFVRYITSKSVGISSKLELTSFRAIKSEVVVEALKLRHTRPVIGFLLFQVTDKFVNVEVKHEARDGNGVRSSYSYIKLIRYFFDQVIEYSEFPLTLMSTIGAIFSAGSFLYGLIILFRKILGFSIASGFTTLVLMISFFGGLTLLSLGIIGRYLSRVLRSQGFEPSYVISEKTFREP